jgi:hypothetical protein
MGVVCCHVEVSALGWSLVQGSPTECSMSECDGEALIMGKLWPTRGCCAFGGKNRVPVTNWIWGQSARFKGEKYLSTLRENRTSDCLTRSLITIITEVSRLVVWNCSVKKYKRNVRQDLHLKMEAADSSETLVPIYQKTRRHKTGSHLNLLKPSGNFRYHQV